MKLTFKKILTMTLCLLTLLTCFALPAQAFADSRVFYSASPDYSVEGWYYVNTVYPSGYTYSYIYDKSSSMNGNNLGRVNDGEQVYVYYAKTGEASKVWAYCAYYSAGRTIKGFIRYENLSVYPPVAPTQGPTLGWYYVDTVYPSGYTYSYIYDQPSSINGKNLGRVNDGQYVYVYRLSENAKWAYCEYSAPGKTIKGYIHFENLRKAY